MPRPDDYTSIPVTQSLRHRLMWMKTRNMSYGDVVEELIDTVDFNDTDIIQRPPDEEEIEYDQ